VNKNIGEPTDEMSEIFSRSYLGKSENIPIAIRALRDYGCLQIMIVKVLMKELKVSLSEASMLIQLHF
jgi:hypothetical protein